MRDNQMTTSELQIALTREYRDARGPDIVELRAEPFKEETYWRHGDWRRYVTPVVQKTWQGLDKYAQMAVFLVADSVAQNE